MRQRKSNPDFVQLPLPEPTEERWKPVSGYDGRYEASDLGHIRCLDMGKGKGKRKRVLKTGISTAGYVTVKLWVRGDRSGIGVHQLVAAAFIGSCPDGCEVNHRDCDKSNNRPENLEYITHEANIDHARKAGRWDGHVPQGEKAWNHKLTDADIPVIRQLVAAGRSTREVGAQYGVSNVCIVYIVHRRTWKHIP